MLLTLADLDGDSLVSVEAVPSYGERERKFPWHRYRLVSREYVTVIPFEYIVWFVVWLSFAFVIALVVSDTLL